MILTAHAVAGAAIALTFKNNTALALTLAALSHFALDAIPHWHYPITNLKRKLENLNDDLPKTAILKDLLVITIDFLLGIGISLLVGLNLAPNYILIILGGAVFGIIPDFLQLLYYLFPKFPLVQIQNFHTQIHSKKRIDERHILGISSQLLIVVICVLIMGIV